MHAPGLHRRPAGLARRRAWPEARGLIPEETAIALTYNGGTYAVMMGDAAELARFRDRLQPERRHRAVA